MQHSVSLFLSKFDVAERQLNQAIKLFFDGGDPVAIHTIAEASSQVLYDIREKFGAVSKIRDADIIKPECRKEWLANVMRSRNFFKHADRDAGAVHEFKEEFNHFSLLDAVNMYLTAKGEWTPETLVFVQWYAVTYPQAVHQNTAFAALMDGYRASMSHGQDEHKALCTRVIAELRKQGCHIAGVTLESGVNRDA